MTDLDHPYIAGLSVLGGDPFHKANYEKLYEVLLIVKERFPEKDIWIWTGYTLKQLQDDPNRSKLLEVATVLIDGKYIKDIPPTSPWHGSGNL